MVSKNTRSGPYKLRNRDVPVNNNYPQAQRRGRARRPPTPAAPEPRHQLMVSQQPVAPQQDIPAQQHPLSIEPFEPVEYPTLSLLGIPPELRNIIYGYTFSDAAGANDLRALLTNRQFYHEAGHIAFNRTAFYLADQYWNGPFTDAHLDTRINHLSAERRTHITHVRIPHTSHALRHLQARDIHPIYVAADITDLDTFHPRATLTFEVYLGIFLAFGAPTHANPMPRALYLRFPTDSSVLQGTVLPNLDRILEMAGYEHRDRVEQRVRRRDVVTLGEIRIPLVRVADGTHALELRFERGIGSALSTSEQRFIETGSFTAPQPEEDELAEEDELVDYENSEDEGQQAEEQHDEERAEHQQIDSEEGDLREEEGGIASNDQGGLGQITHGDSEDHIVDKIEGNDGTLAPHQPTPHQRFESRLNPNPRQNRDYSQDEDYVNE